MKPTFTKSEFMEWSRGHEGEKHCHYCNVKESYIYKLSQMNDAGRKTQILGLDRKDSTRGYTIDNIVLCCLACNRAKGDIFSYNEFKKYIAPGIRKAYLIRLGFSLEEIERTEPSMLGVCEEQSSVEEVGEFLYAV